MASLTGIASNFSIPASGFLVHPRIVMTAAHAVTFMAGEKLARVLRVRVELGSIAAWADLMAVDSEYVGSRGQLSRTDMAALRLPWPVCASNQTLSLTAGAATAAQVPATIWGWRDGALSTRNVQAALTDGMLTYPSPDLPGFSGGPLVAPQGASLTGQAIGIHVGFRADAGRGEAVPLHVDDARGAMESLGFRF